MIGNVSDFEYRIAIDAENSIARPSYKTSSIDYVFSANSSSGVKLTGNSVTKNYTAETYINQRFATKIRNLTGALWQWNGQLDLYPSMDHFKDETRLPNVNVNIDNAAPWEQFANSPFAAQFGEWRTVASSTSVSSQVAAAGTFQESMAHIVTGKQIGRAHV